MLLVKRFCYLVTANKAETIWSCRALFSLLLYKLPATQRNAGAERCRAAACAADHIPRCRFKARAQTALYLPPKPGITLMCRPRGLMSFLTRMVILSRWLKMLSARCCPATLCPQLGGQSRLGSGVGVQVRAFLI